MNLKKLIIFFPLILFFYNCKEEIGLERNVYLNGDKHISFIKNPSIWPSSNDDVIIALHPIGTNAEDLNWILRNGVSGIIPPAEEIEKFSVYIPQGAYKAALPMSILNLFGQVGEVRRKANLSLCKRASRGNTYFEYGINYLNLVRKGHEGFKPNRSQSIIAAQDIIKAIEEINRENPSRKVTIVGYSGGGGMAFLIAAIAPHLIDTVVSMSAYVDEVVFTALKDKKNDLDFLSHIQDIKWVILNKKGDIVVKEDKALSGFKKFSEELNLSQDNIKHKMYQGNHALNQRDIDYLSKGLRGKIRRGTNQEEAFWSDSDGDDNAEYLEEENLNDVDDIPLLAIDKKKKKKGKID